MSPVPEVNSRRSPGLPTPELLECSWCRAGLDKRKFQPLSVDTHNISRLSELLASRPSTGHHPLPTLTILDDKLHTLWHPYQSTSTMALLQVLGVHWRLVSPTLHLLYHFHIEQPPGYQTADLSTSSRTSSRNHIPSYRSPPSWTQKLASSLLTSRSP